MNKEAWSCSIRLAPPPLFINASLQCHYVYRTPMQASIYGDLGTVLWDLRGPIMSLSHYELGRKKIIAIIGVRLATTPIFAFLPPCLSNWAVCPPLFMCHNTPTTQEELSKAKLLAFGLFLFIGLLSLHFCLCIAHNWLTPEFGYAVQPSSAVATRVSITVSAERENRRQVSLRNQSYSCECRQLCGPCDPATITSGYERDESWAAVHPESFCQHHLTFNSWRKSRKKEKKKF